MGGPRGDRRRDHHRAERERNESGGRTRGGERPHRPELVHAPAAGNEREREIACGGVGLKGFRHHPI